MRYGLWVVGATSLLATVVGAGCGGGERAEPTGAGGSAGHDGGSVDGPGGSDGGTDDGGETSSCPALDSPMAGVVAAPERTPGSMATYTCQMGYTLNGSATRICQASGIWSDAPATCAVKDCGPLQAPKNGSVSAPQTTFGATATYSCGSGFGPSGSATRTCQLDGTWSGVDPTCVVADCPALPGPMGGGVVAPTLTVGSTATYSCAAGYALTGMATRTCQIDHNWSGAAPTCKTRTCGQLTAPDNGSVDVPSMNYGAVATYSCKPGFGPSGSSTRTCQADGTWTGTEPSCVLANCPALASPAGGMVSAPTLTFGATATCTGSTWYDRAGAATRTCQNDGTWSGTAPTCVVQDCGALKDPTHAAV